MKKFGLRRSMIALGTLAICITLVLVLLWPRDSARTIRIATAGSGGTYYPLGTRLAQVLKELPERSRLAKRRIEDAYAWETDGSAENIRLLCNPRPDYKNAPRRNRAGKDDAADVAFVESTALAMAAPDQREKIGNYKKRLTNPSPFAILFTCQKQHGKLLEKPSEKVSPLLNCLKCSLRKRLPPSGLNINCGAGTVAVVIAGA